MGSSFKRALAEKTLEYIIDSDNIEYKLELYEALEKMQDSFRDACLDNGISFDERTDIMLFPEDLDEYDKEYYLQLDDNSRKLEAFLIKNAEGAGYYRGGRVFIEEIEDIRKLPVALCDLSLFKRTSVITIDEETYFTNFMSRDTLSEIKAAINVSAMSKCLNMEAKIEQKEEQLKECKNTHMEKENDSSLSSDSEINKLSGEIKSLRDRCRELTKHIYQPRNRSFDITARRDYGTIVARAAMENLLAKTVSEHLGADVANSLIQSVEYKNMVEHAISFSAVESENNGILMSYDMLVPNINSLSLALSTFGRYTEEHPVDLRFTWISKKALTMLQEDNELDIRKNKRLQRVQKVLNRRSYYNELFKANIPYVVVIVFSKFLAWLSLHYLSHPSLLDSS